MTWVRHVANSWGEIEMKQAFVLLYRPGPAWIEGKPVSEQPLREHLDYLSGLYQTGTLLMAGPFTDDTGGLGILNVASQDEAENILSRDPAVIEGVLTAELHLWDIVIKGASGIRSTT